MIDDIYFILLSLYRALRIHPPTKQKTSKREPTWVKVMVSINYFTLLVIYKFQFIVLKY